MIVAVGHGLLLTASEENEEYLISCLPLVVFLTKILFLKYIIDQLIASLVFIEFEMSSEIETDTNIALTMLVGIRSLQLIEIDLSC